MEEAGDEAGDTTQQAMSGADLRTLLIVDDSEEDREIYRRLLEFRSGPMYEFKFVETGEDALRALDDSRPNCILIDYHLPDCTGLELLAEILARGRVVAPVVMVTGLGDEMVAVEAMKRGATDYLTKASLTSEALRRCIENSVEKAALRGLVERQNQELKRLYAGEIERRNQLEQRVIERDRFLAMLAHELRNPLSAISVAGELLNLPGLSAEQMKSASEIIGRQAHHMARMLDELLDVARITQGKIELKLQLLPLRQVVEHAIETCRGLVDERRHALTVVNADQELLVEVDPTRIEQVLVNLIRNAAKYTPPGGQIHVEVVEERNEVAISVSDNGAGIPREMQLAIFDPFVQTERAIDRTQGGLGLGLSIVKRLIEMHGGQAMVESAGEGRGSMFSIRLPKTPRAARPHPEHKPNESARPRRIVVIEDNLDAAEMLRQLLQVQGHDVAVAGDGAEGLRLVEELTPDVAVVDIGLPVMNGFEVARRIRALPGIDGMKLIALTGYGQPEYRRQAVDAGFDAHLVKPVDLAALADLLQDGDGAAPGPTAALKNT